MSNLLERINNLQSKLERHKNTDLKETPTRTIFIDPLLESLGWDVENMDEVELGVCPSNAATEIKMYN